MSRDAVPGLVYDAPSGRQRASDRRRRPPRRRGVLPRLLAVLVLVTGLLAGVIYAAGRMVGPVGRGAAGDFVGPGEGSVTVRVTPSSTASDIARVLAADGVIKSARAFIDVAAADDRSRALQPGWYRLRHRMSAATALEMLLDPQARAQPSLTIAEGTTTRRLLQVLSDRTRIPLAQFERAARDPAALGVPTYARGNVEGFLFPSTYDLPPKATATQVMRPFVQRYLSVTSDLDLSGGASRLGRTPYEILIVASILEREVVNQTDRAKVARVIYNRLADRSGTFRKLDLDSTVRYVTDDWTRPLTQNQLRVTSPYNTRLHPGLPPGPIGNPGEAALRAALHPARGSWLYFLTLPTSRINLFATTDREWAVALSRYRAEGGGG